MHHERFPYLPIVDREPLRFPNGARVAVWVIPNIEHFHFDKPSVSIASATMHLKPDVLNYAWRDYGARVGVWRMMEILDRYGIKGTYAVNSEACEQYPQIIAAGNSLGCEWMAHGKTNSIILNHQSEEEERELIAEVIETIHTHTGARPKGWLGPALSETWKTPDLLAELGIEYVCDWVNDEQPYPINVRSGQLLSIPYSIEINDIPVFLERNLTPEDFCRMITDQFDVLYEDGAQTGRVMAISLHPLLIGHPFRAKYLDRALAHIAGRQEVWMTRGCDIADWYRTNYLQPGTD